MDKVKMINLLGMLIVIISVFLPFVSSMGSMYSTDSGIAIFFIVVASMSGIFGGIIAKKWAAAIGLVLGGLLLLLAFKYQGDASGAAGFGLHLFTVGSLALTIGNLMTLFKKKK
jgi:hypothetical protein